MKHSILRTVLSLFLVAPALLGFAGTAGCGQPTSIQPGEVGKQLGTHGLEEAIHPPGAFRLEVCIVSACPKLVRLQVNKSTQELKIDHLFLPKSSINISNVQVGLQFQVKQDTASINKIFEEVRSVHANGQAGETDRVLLITDEMLYATYLQRLAPNAIVTALRNHTVDEILTNVPEISENTKQMINQMLADTPIEVTEVGFPNGIGEIPHEVMEKMHQLYAVRADMDRRIKALGADLIVEDHRQAVQHKRLGNQLRNAATAGVSYETYVQLTALDTFSDAAFAGTPVGLGTPAPFNIPAGRVVKSSDIPTPVLLPVTSSAPTTPADAPAPAPSTPAPAKSGK